MEFPEEATAPQLGQTQPFEFELNADAMMLDRQLKAHFVTQRVEIEDPASNSVNPDTLNNASRLVLRCQDLEVLGNKQGDLALDLLALAGPYSGPNGSAIFINGFNGGQLPSKDAIREIRINKIPLGSESDRVGFGAIWIIARPGSEKYTAAV